MAVLNLKPVSSSSSSQEQPPSVQLFIIAVSSTRSMPAKFSCPWPPYSLLRQTRPAEPRSYGGSQTRLLRQQLSSVSVKREKYCSPGHTVTQNSNLASLKPVFLFGIKEAMVWTEGWGGGGYFCSADTHPIFSYWRGKRSGRGLKESHAEQPLQRQGEGRQLPKYLDGQAIPVTAYPFSMHRYFFSTALSLK